MNAYFVHVHRDNSDPFNYPHLGKVQYFKVELNYHGFSILEHPAYPGAHRARFIVRHHRDSIWSYILLRYDDVAFRYRRIFPQKMR
jgi:hypothetical protein